MKIRRRTIILAVAVPLLLLALLFLLPMLLRGPIEARVRRTIDRSVNARVDWTNARLSLLRDFPDLTLQLRDLDVVGTGDFARDTLLSVARLRLALDLPSVLRGVRGSGPIEVRSIDVNRPSLRLLVLEDGRASWDIMKPAADTARAAKRSLDLRLDHLLVTDASVTLDNRQSRLGARVAGLRHTLSGDFGKQRFTLATSTTADSVSVDFAGVPYLSRTRLVLRADLDADMAAKRFTLREGALRANDLVLRLAGTTQLDSSATALDLHFDAPRTEFRQLLSLVPALYRKDFERLQTSGAMSVQGQVRGRYGKGEFPSFAVDAAVDNGSFRYPELPLPARDIALRLTLRNPGGHADSTVLDVQRFHARIEGDVVDGTFRLRTPISDPDIALRVQGRLDLANVPRTIPLDSVQELSGRVAADASMNARLSDVRGKRYDRIGAAGTIALQQLVLRASTLRQPLHIDDALLRLTPSRAELASFRGTAGSSDLAMSGSLDNLLGFVLGREELRGAMRVDSRRFALDEWRSDEELHAIQVPGNIDFTLDAHADTVHFGLLALQNARGVLHLKDRRVTLQDFRTGIFGGDLAVTGFYETTDSVKPAFDVTLGLTSIDVPAAFAGLKTVQLFAPVARYAQGRANVKVALKGNLGQDMMPVYAGLTGLGSLVTKGLVLKGFPGLDRLADALRLDLLHDPGFVDLKSSFSMKEGRLNVRPFDAAIGPLTMNVSGSNGIDQSLDYDLALRLPRALLGGQVNDAIARIAQKGAPAGFNLQAAETVTVGAKLTGSVTSPVLATRLRESAGASLAATAGSLKQQAEARVDSAADAARQRAAAEAARLIAQAEQRAAVIRAQARVLADSVRQQAYTRADSLEARAKNPVAKLAAREAANRIKKEADARAAALLRDADAKGQALIDKARQAQPDTL